MTSNPPAGTRVLGTLRTSGGTGVARIEDRYDTDIDDLWSAITEPARVARWWAEVDGDLRLGGEFRARVFASGWEGTGRIEACEPPRRLQVLTRETDESAAAGVGAAPFTETLEATLTADGDQTILVIEIRGLPMDKIAGYGAGWQLHAEDLAAYVAGREPGDAGVRWAALQPVYEELAATLGGGA